MRGLSDGLLASRRLFPLCFCIFLRLSSIRGRRLRRSANLSQYMYPTWSQADANSHQNPSKNRPTGTPNPSQIGQMVPKSGPKTILEGGRLQNGSWGVPSYAFLVLGDFGRHFGPSWAPRDSQNRAFWHQDASKVGKMRSWKGSQKKHEILIEI